MEEITKKLNWYKTQLKSQTKRFIESNRRIDRDSVLRLTGKVDAYKEMIELLSKGLPLKEI